MSKQLQDDIEKMLYLLDQGGLSAPPTDEVQIEAAIEMDPKTRTPTLHVFLVDDEEEPNEEENAVEGSIEAEEEEQRAPEEASTDQEPGAPETHPMSWESPLWARVVGLLGLVILLGPALLIPIGSPLFLLPITVMIQPIMRLVEFQTILPIAGRPLPERMVSQSKTVQATGMGYQEAQPASGIITFYNAALFSQVIPAGTLLTGQSGTQITTDEEAVIPPGMLATNGQASVTAHAIQPGAAGNIRAGDIYGPCCRINILAANGAFTGGQAARSYQVVTKADREQVTNALKASLQGSIQALFSAQIQPGEALVTPVCSPKISTNKQVGEEAQEVAITIEMRCRASVYSRTALQQAIHQKLDQEALQQLGSSYQRRGEIKFEVLHTTAQSDTIKLEVKASSTYAYQFTQEQLEGMKAGIAGKGKAEARDWLEHQPGIVLVNVNQEQVPTRLQFIQLVIVNSK